jgi:Ran GTPase-activating protein (RanGAP) involved in mRNA processing and transport
MITISEIEMNLSKMSINDKRLVECLEHIQNNRQLQILNLSHNKITSTGLSQLLKVVAKHPSLEVLYLNNNCLDGDAVSMIKANAGNLRKLRYVGMRDNKSLGNVEVYKEVVKMLKKQKIRIDIK